MPLLKHVNVGVVFNNFATALEDYFNLCISNSQDPVLDMYPEGYNLYENGAWDKILQTAKEKNINIDNITIEICDYQANYPCKIVYRKPYWLDLIKRCNVDWATEYVAQPEKLFGHFIGRPSWDRVVLHDKVKSTNNCLYTFWTGAGKPPFTDYTIKKLKEFYSEQDAEKYKQILLSAPHNNIRAKLLRRHYWLEFPANILDIKHHYDNIFVDIVSETETANNTTFITEKTIRPMLFKKPFVIMAGQGHLGLLHKLGFKTFNKWWNEDYDNMHGVDRVNAICKVIDSIDSRQQKMYNFIEEMKDVIEHNHSHCVKQGWHKHRATLGIKNE